MMGGWRWIQRYTDIEIEWVDGWINGWVVGWMGDGWMDR